jgi:DNA polymerase-3 subunit gamma/tau
MRELRENVRYQPARDRYKIFIIDEAHQITSEAFNALLKTIEEPPEWAVFVLCTTEAHKIPATIASRCQHFSFRSVDFEDLMARMAWICTQEGIEADAEALAVLAAAGEGSVRDSLSALDQAIACCGAKLNAAEVRALLGAFSTESLETVADALLAGDARRMLEVVDELERNGHNLQHFSRELARYIRNLLVARIAGAEGAARLIAASPAERQRLADTGTKFSEEDLTRYLQLSLDLFRDLQFSLQPRFHLELGLLRLVQAGRLLPIEQALADFGTGGALKVGGRGPGVGDAPVKSAPSVAPPKPTASPAPPRTGPSPFDVDRAKKASAQPSESPAPISRPLPEPKASAQPSPSPASAPWSPAPEPKASAQPGASPAPEAPPVPSDWRQRLHGALVELGMPFTADAVENSCIVESAGELEFVTSAANKLMLRPDELQQALKRVSPRAMRIKVTVGDAGSAPSGPLDKPLARPTEDEATVRALANPEVQRFREVFGGEIRKVRNLKE